MFDSTLFTAGEVVVGFSLPMFVAVLIATYRERVRFAKASGSLTPVR
jgi:hypothetical protein